MDIPTDVKQFGVYLKTMRTNRNWTLEQVAERTNLSSSFIWRIEEGKRVPSLTTRLNILLNGLELSNAEAHAYLSMVISNKEGLRRFTN